jgi:hypothetical protein
VVLLARVLLMERVLSMALKPLSVCMSVPLTVVTAHHEGMY